MILYLDQHQQQLDNGEFSEGRYMAAFCVINNQLQVFINSRFTEEYDHESQMMKKCFVNYTGIDVDVFKVTLLKIMGNVKLISLRSSPFSNDLPNIRCFTQIHNAIT